MFVVYIDVPLLRVLRKNEIVSDVNLAIVETYGHAIATRLL